MCGVVDITCIPLTCMHGRLVHTSNSGDRCAIGGLQTRLPCRGRQLTSWDNGCVCAAINSDYDPSAVFSQRKN